MQRYLGFSASAFRFWLILPQAACLCRISGNIILRLSSPYQDREYFIFLCCLHFRLFWGREDCIWHSLRQMYWHFYWQYGWLGVPLNHIRYFTTEALSSPANFSTSIIRVPSTLHKWITGIGLCKIKFALSSVS